MARTTVTRRLPGAPPLRFTLGVDIVGVVDEAGPGANPLEIGAMVAGGTWARGIGGGYTEFICLPATELVPVPRGVDPTEAVCLVANYLTAHLHLHSYGQVRRGERLLVHGAAGGAGTALLELGRLADLEMYGTASETQIPVVSALGATPIDYRNDDFVEQLATSPATALTSSSIPSAAHPTSGAPTGRCAPVAG